MTYQLGGLCAVVLRGAGNRRILNSGYGKLAHSGKTCATPGKRQRAGWCTTRVTLAIEELARQLVRFPLRRLLAVCAADAAPLAPRGTAVNHGAAVCANGRSVGHGHGHATLVFACCALAPPASQTLGCVAAALEISGPVLARPSRQLLRRPALLSERARRVSAAGRSRPSGAGWRTQIRHSTGGRRCPGCESRAQSRRRAHPG